MARERDGKMKIGDAAFCALDVETTGLPSISRIVEIGAVRFRLGEQGEHFQTLVDPGCPIPSNVSMIHGITDDMVAGAPRAPEMLAELIEFTSGCTLLAHNARFDASIISTELSRARLRMPPSDVICTIVTAKRLLPKMPDYKLKTLVRELGIEVEHHHRALSDARAARDIFERAVTSSEGWKKKSLGYYLERCSWGTLGCEPDEEMGVPPELEEVGRAIGEAIDCASEIVLTYRLEKKRPWAVQVRPLNVLCYNGNAYLEAECNDGQLRSFRLEKITSIRMQPAEWAD